MEEQITVYRGGCRTGDSSQPVIWTARVYATEREAAAAIKRAAKQCGYRVTRLQIFASPIIVDPNHADIDGWTGDRAETWLRLARPVEQSGEVE